MQNVNIIMLTPESYNNFTVLSLSNTKPIIWKEQSEDYLGRSEDWDNFPNGRWGDARSPGKKVFFSLLNFFFILKKIKNK